VVRTDGFRLEGSSTHGVEGWGVLDDKGGKFRLADLRLASCLRTK